MKAPTSFRTSRAALTLIADQALSSGISFVVLVLFARASSKELFGQLALMMAISSVIQGLLRATVSDLLLIRSGQMSSGQREQALRTAAGLAIVLGGGSGLLTALGGGVFSSASSLWIVFGLSLPGLLLADLARYVAFSELSPARALFLDGAWAALLLTGASLLGVADPLRLMLAWALSGTALGLLGLVWCGTPSIRALPLWSHVSERSARQFGVEYLAGVGGSQLGTLAVASLGSLGAAGALRGIAALFGPVNIGFQALTAVAIPHAARRREQLTAVASLLATVLLAATLGTAALIQLAPTRVGTMLLGPTWESSAALLVPYAVFVAAGCICGACFVVLRVRESRRSLWTRIASAAMILVGTVVGAVAGDAFGAAVGMALGQCLAVPLWLMAARESSPPRRAHPDSGPSAADAPEVAVVGAFPPPIHGMTWITERVACTLATHARVIRLDTAPGELTPGARYHLRRAARVLAAILRLGTTRSMRASSLTYLVCDAGWGSVYGACIALTARLRKYRMVVHHHNFSYLLGRKRSIALLVAAAGRSAIHLVLSASMGARLRAVYGSELRCQVLHNAAFLDEEPVGGPRAERPLTIGHLSNLSRAKGSDLVLDLASRLSTTGSSVRVLLAGPVADGGLDTEISHALRDHGRVLDYVGAVSGEAKAKFFGRLDLFVFPSRLAEAQPLVILEALRHGVPVVTVDRGGTRELVGEAGWCLGTPEEAVDWIVTAVRNDTQLARTLDARRSLATKRFLELRRTGLSQLESFIDLARARSSVDSPGATHVREV